jgi:hypothetical protein
MLRKALLSVALFLSVLAAVAAAAPDISTGRYSLTLPAGWLVNPQPPPSDSFTIATKLAAGATLLLISDLAESMPADPDSLLGSTDMIPDGITLVERKNLTLGGKAFAMAEYRDTSATGPGADSRYRAYATTQNGVFFLAILNFMPGLPGTPVTTELETALAGLTLKGSSAIRPLARGRAVLRGERGAAGLRDVLGREAPAAGRGAFPGVALFVRD